MKLKLTKQYPHERREKVLRLPTGAEVLPERAVDENNDLCKYLARRGLNYELALNNGWYFSRSAGDSAGRIVIPATNSLGYAYWQARAVDPNVEPRYMSPAYAATDSLIIVWPCTIRRVAIVEGPMDALAAAEHDCIGVALMGKKVRSSQFDSIANKFAGHWFLIVPDSDGLDDAGRWMAELAKRSIRAEIVLCSHKDLASTPSHIRSRILG